MKIQNDEQEIMTSRKRKFVLVTILILLVLVVVTVLVFLDAKDFSDNQEDLSSSRSSEVHPSSSTRRISSGATLETTTFQSTLRATPPIMSSTSGAQFPETCETEECVKLGARMRALMNISTDPCDDFYEFACGNYPQIESLPAEVYSHLTSDRNNLEVLLKTYKPATKSERIAMVFVDKCMKTKVDLDFDEGVWKSDDLTDLLIEMSKIEPIETGLIRNYITFGAENDKIMLILILRHGIGQNSPFRPVMNRILEKNEGLRTFDPIYLDEILDDFTFLNLTRYYLNLLPEENREEGLKWRIGGLRNDFYMLEKVVEIMDFEKIKEYLYEKWKAKLEGYLVREEDPYYHCFMKAESLFPGTFAMIFIKNFVKSENIEKSNQIFEDLKNAFNEMLDENTWIDEDLKNNLREELKVLKSSIGIPDEHKDLSNIDRMYARVEKEQKVEDQSYLTLVRNLLKMNSEETFLRVARKETITYEGNPMDFSANYWSVSHRVSIASSLLNYPYIDQNLPEWNIVASIGFLVAHEIGHAFDAQLYFFNQSAQEISMSQDMKNEFDQRIDCIIKKYDEFQFPDGSFSNGVLTKQEDSADMIGFNLAYRLFKKLDKKQQKLPGFEEYTVEQSYFQRLAYTWCGPDLDQESIDFQKMDVHSANKFRVNGMMSNSVDFARAFGCKKGSPMNPEKKCPLFK